MENLKPLTDLTNVVNSASKLPKPPGIKRECSPTTKPLTDLTDVVNSASKLPKPPGIKRECSPAMAEHNKRFKFEAAEKVSRVTASRIQTSKAPSVIASRLQTSRIQTSKAPNVTASRLLTSRIQSSKAPSVTASRLQTSHIQTSRAPITMNPRRETMPARQQAVQRTAASIRPDLSISTIQGANKKKVFKKRPNWDYKGQIQDLEEQLKNTDSLMLRIRDLEYQNKELTDTLLEKQELATTVCKEVDDLRNLLRQKERKIDDLIFSKSCLERQKSTLEGELNAKTQENCALKSAIAQQSSAQASLRAELEVNKLGLENANQQLLKRDSVISNLKEILKEHEATINEDMQRMREHDALRRKLHNTIQELKGNIRVFCRVRPLIGDEVLSQNGSISHIAFPDLDSRVLELDHIPSNGLHENLSTSKNRKKHEFTFDHVFNPDSSQQDVFNEFSQLVQSALDGYNVCIFAYGPTGSGKTYTMEGKSNRDNDMGMIPRATMQVFETVELLKDKRWTFQFEVSFLEIYNELIKDLLGDKDDLKHEIKMDTDQSNSVHVTNLTKIEVKSSAQIHDLLRKASHRRAVGETKLNMNSSRSHSVFTLVLKGKNEETGESCHGFLNMVDLAGSERLKESGSEGKRLKETQAINKSLSNLSVVFTAIANKDNHIPYRNSKLTYLLQNSLGGNSKTLMIVNVSPKEDNYNETLNSLRFATTVNNCNIGTAQKRIK